MKFQNIIHNEHFNNLAIIFAIPFHAQPSSHNDLYKRLKSEMPFWSLWKAFDKATPIDVPLNKTEVTKALTDLLLVVTTAMPELLWYTKDDLDWFFDMLDGEYDSVMTSLFKTWVSATHTFLTPKQVAEITNMSESNWRNRAAGQPGYKPIPGCKKPGKDWLIPLAVLQAQGTIDWSYRHTVTPANNEIQINHK